MCGIAGKYSLDGAPVDRALLTRMADAMFHRGPDEGGLYAHGPFGMVIRRLSIIDLQSGHQPISNEDGSVWVALNGEIYNYVELRDQLRARGHAFRTDSDTEAIVHLYEERGDHCVDDLRGMFGFAVWDQRTHTLLLARDRLGKKPLYYAVLPGRGGDPAAQRRPVGGVSERRGGLERCGRRHGETHGTSRGDSVDRLPRGWVQRVAVRQARGQPPPQRPP